MDKRDFVTLTKRTLRGQLHHRDDGPNGVYVSFDDELIADALWTALRNGHALCDDIPNQDCCCFQAGKEEAVRG